MLRVVVVGGGAAGFFGAIHGAGDDTTVTVLEAGREVLSKVRISGGGRCNVTHSCFEIDQLVQHYPRGSKELRGAFTRFQPQHTIEWFKQQGVTLKTEADGRMFPITDDSNTIVNCLIQVAHQLGVKIRTQAPVIAINSFGQYLELTLKSGEKMTADRVLLATGGSPQGLKLAAQLGHKIVPTVPSLFTFTIKDTKLQQLAGISLDRVAVSISNSKFSQSGALVFTHWGLSGSAVLKLSAWGAREFMIGNIPPRSGSIGCPT